jgi:Toastrack DUF4097
MHAKNNRRWQMLCPYYVPTPPASFFEGNKVHLVSVYLVKKMSRRMVSFNLHLLVLISLVGFSLPLLAASEITDSYNKIFQVDGRPSLIIKNVDGRTRILAKEGAGIQVQVTKEVHDAKDSAEAKKAADRVEVRLEQVGNRIEIAVRYPKSFSVVLFGSRPSVLVHFEVTAPSASDITASMVDGEMETRRFNGQISISATDGDIHATHLSGNAEVSLVDGDFTSEECTGHLSMRSIDGNMHVKDFQGSVEAKSGDGDLNLEGVFQSLNSRTTDGNMEIRARSGSTTQNNWSIHSGDGDLVVYLPNPFPANVDLKTGDGKIVTSFPIEISGRISERNVSGKMNGGGNLLAIETRDGDITIMQSSE